LGNVFALCLYIKTITPMKKNYRRLSAIILMMLVNMGFASAQFTAEVDSLMKVAADAPDSTAAVLNNTICWKIRNSSPEIAIQYASKAIDCAKKVENWAELVKGYSYIGVCQRNLGNYSEALEYYAMGLNTAVEHNVKDQEAYAHINIANIYLYHNSYNECEENLDRALKIGKELADSSIMGYGYLNLGRVYMGRKEYEKADSMYMESIAIRSQCERLNYQVIVPYKYMADSHAEQGLTDLAKREYQACLRNPYIEKDYDLISDVTHKLAKIYYEKNMLDSSLALAEQSLYYSKLVGSKFSIMNAYDAIANVHFARKDYKAAADNYNNQIRYNDSIFNEKLSQSVFNIQYSAEQTKKQSEINGLQAEKEKTRMYIWGLLFFLLMGVGIIILVVKNNKKVTKLNEKLQKQQAQIADSISYAMRIQRALLPDTSEFKNVFRDSFVYYAPRNVVSGDYYWQHNDADFQIIVCADCTGHGVPGAFVSMLGVSSLHEIVGSYKLRDAGEILNRLRTMVKTLLKQTVVDDGQPKDGMDIAIMVIDKSKRELHYSGGNIPLIYIRDGKLEQIKPTPNPIGVFVREVPFESHTLQLMDGDRIYLSSDGYSSQFGGPKGAKIKMSGYKDILKKIYDKPMGEQKVLLEAELLKWQGSRPQIDDILVMGFEV